MGGSRWPGHSSGNKRSSRGSRLSERGRAALCGAAGIWQGPEPPHAGRLSAPPLEFRSAKRSMAHKADYKLQRIPEGAQSAAGAGARGALDPGPGGQSRSIRTTQAQGTAAGSLLGNRVTPRRLRPGLPPLPGPTPGHRAHGPESTVGEHGGDAGGQDPREPRTGRSILPTLAPEQHPVALPGPSGDVRTGVPWALPNHPLCPPRQVPGEHEEPQRGHDPGLPLQGWSQA